MAKKSDILKKAADAMRKRCLAYPQTVEEFPWDHSAFKIKKKVFLFMFDGIYKEQRLLSLTMKLPLSHRDAAKLPFAEPSGYGLAKTGWVTSKFKPGDDVPLEMLYEWLDESFRAIAPVKILALLDGEAAAAPKRKKGKAK